MQKARKQDDYFPIDELQSDRWKNLKFIIKARHYGKNIARAAKAKEKESNAQ